MTQRKKLSEEEKSLIRDTYRDCGNNLAATTKALAYTRLSKSIIFRLIRSDNGLCACGKNPAPNHKLCQNCLDSANTFHADARRKKVASGICAACNNPQSPNSKVYCEEHMLMNRQGLRDLRKKRKELGVCLHCEGVLAKTSKRYCQKHLDYHNIKSLNHRFDGNAILALERDSYKCVICGDDGSVSRLEVHHLDRNKSNNTLVNLAVLCGNCHRALTWMLSSSDPHAIYDFMLRHYFQGLGRDFQSQDSPNSRGLQLPVTG